MRATIILLFLIVFTYGCGGPKKPNISPDDPRLKGAINPDETAGGAVGPDPTVKQKGKGKAAGKKGGDKKGPAKGGDKK